MASLGEALVNGDVIEVKYPTSIGTAPNGLNRILICGYC